MSLFSILCMAKCKRNKNIDLPNPLKQYFKLREFDSLSDSNTMS